MPSPFTEEIYRDWEKLIQGKERTLDDGRQPHPDQIIGWQALYEKATNNGEWRVPAPDAYLVASLGITLALQEFRFEDAAKLAKSYLDHPEAEGHAINWGTTSTRLGIALLLAGQTEDGVKQLKAVFADERQPFTQSKHLSIRNDLVPTLSDLGLDKKAHPSLAEFILDLLQNWPDPDVTPQPVPPSPTHRQLSECLTSTYAPQD